jgi:hypothetical protein
MLYVQKYYRLSYSLGDVIKFDTLISGIKEFEFGNCFVPGSLTTGSQQTGLRGIASDT